MEWTKLHATILRKAFENVLGKAEAGSMAFVRCLTPDVVEALANDTSFTPSDWQVWRVADSDNRDARTITADRAVEIRETKCDAALLLVDTGRAGAGMDGIYGATREVDEASLFTEALRLAGRELTNQLSSKHRQYAERALKMARGHGRRFSVSSWTEFDFLCRVAAGRRHPGGYLYLLGLWPVQEPDEFHQEDGLDVSRMFVDGLLGTAVSALTPGSRIEALRLLNPSQEQMADLDGFLRSAATKPLLSALAELAAKKHLWVNALQTEAGAQVIQSIELSTWRTTNGKIARWSGLEEEKPDEPPVLILKRDADRTGDYSKLEVRWKARPENLKKAAVEYRVAIMTDMDEELAAQEVTHSSKREEKCRFSNDDFSILSEDALISANVVVSVIGNESVEEQKSEEFVIRFGEPLEREPAGAGKKVRTFSEGLIELSDREMVSSIASSMATLDSKGFVLLRTPERSKSFRVFRPPLIDEVEKRWAEQAGAIGRWRVKVRASGVRAGEMEFIAFHRPESSMGASWQSLWDRASTASRRMAERFTLVAEVLARSMTRSPKASIRS